MPKNKVFTARKKKRKSTKITKIFAFTLGILMVYLWMPLVNFNVNTVLRDYLSATYVPVVEAANILTLDDRTVILRGPINMYMAGDIAQQLIDLDMDKVAPINLIIESNGGGVLAGRKILDIIALIRSPVHAQVVGICASMAAIIAVHCDKIHATPGAWFLFHHASYGAQPQDIREVEVWLKFVKQLMREINSSTAKRLGMAPSKYREKIQSTWILTAKEAIEEGYVDGFIKEIKCKKQFGECKKKLYNLRIRRILVN